MQTQRISQSSRVVHSSRKPFCRIRARAATTTAAAQQSNADTSKLLADLKDELQAFGKAPPSQVGIVRHSFCPATQPLKWQQTSTCID